ncbi:hypothetical protein ABW20_dc0104962 [Dactylellina cionopaga]|nr:hypothetical protein ABW20_dc0104962 [Dactylellina cionopaga]
MEQAEVNGMNSVSGINGDGSSGGSTKQKLQLRTNQSLQNQLAHIYEHHQQNGTTSPYIDFQNVLFSHEYGRNNITLMNSMYSPISPMNPLPTDGFSYMNNSHHGNNHRSSHNNNNNTMTNGVGNSNHGGSNNGGGSRLRSSIKSPIEVRPAARRQSNVTMTDVADCSSSSLAASPAPGGQCAQGIASLDPAQLPSKSHSSSQSDFHPQQTHVQPPDQKNTTTKKRRDSMSSLPLHLDVDMQVDSGSLVQGTSGSGGGGSSSTLTEFTKRRNWSQRIIEELQDLLCILTPSGKIRYTSPNTKSITGYGADELLGRMVTDFVHTDDSHIFIREFNEAIASSQQLRLYFRFRRKDGTHVVFEANGHPHFSDQRQMPSNTTTPVCSGFFMMARLYPTKNTALLDSFLEHKVENERLKRRIKELRAEEQEDHQSQIRARNEAAVTSARVEFKIHAAAGDARSTDPAES